MENHQQVPVVNYKTIYTSVCVNRLENNLSYCGDYLLSNSCNSLVINNRKQKQPVNILDGHSNKVNGQNFISNLDSEDVHGQKIDYIISTSYDRSAIIWKIFQIKFKVQYEILYRLKSPNELFLSRCSLKKDNQFYSITSTIDGDLILWNNDKVVQSLKVEYYCFDSKIHSIRRNESRLHFIILAGSDNNLHIFQLDGASLIHIIDLTGHNDWIKCIDCLDLPARQCEFLIATASQDSYVRVWHMRILDHAINSSEIRTTVADLIPQADNSDEKLRLTATLETVLSGHEGIVHGLCWFKKQGNASLQLVTCSEDKTIVIWASPVSSVKPTEINGISQQLETPALCSASAEIWKELQRLGETGETNLPFLSVCLSSDESMLYANSLRGAIHSWRKQGDFWEPDETITGHFEPITDISWERNGTYLLSSSLDKTCRLHATSASDNEWHELARPQVHGHEINCIASLEFGKFASGSEEKTIRTFEATQFFLKSFKNIAMKDLPEISESNISIFPNHAQLPALGLSNRAAQSPYDIGEGLNDKGSSNAWYNISKLVEELAKTEHLDKPPIEEILLQSTLWWETNKLFGHGNELHSLAADSVGSYLASASRANKKELASIIVWECSKFRKVATIDYHSLTVTRLKFSPNNKYLLSVSRDRTWCLSERTNQARPAFKYLIGTNKTNSLHSRIIWDCSWTYDSKYFMTVARDKNAILWSVDKVTSSNHMNVIECATQNQTNCAIQAVDSPNFKVDHNSYLFAFGFEDGSISLSLVSERIWQQLLTLDQFHQLPIKRLAFKPKDSPDRLVLASGGEDCIVKLTELHLK